jgi:hypothetical protein
VAMMPHERSLVEKLKDKPFALIGVNGDREYGDDFKKNVEKHKVTWRSFKDQQGEDQPEISTTWNLGGWPTLYLIDHEGIIRKIWLGGPEENELDEEIEKAVTITEKKKG